MPAISAIIAYKRRVNIAVVRAWCSILSMLPIFDRSCHRCPWQVTLA